jgi:hypothetical protein
MTQGLAEAGAVVLEQIERVAEKNAGVGSGKYIALLKQ